MTLLKGGAATEQKKEKYWSAYARRYDDYAEFVVGRGLRTAISAKLSEERSLGKVLEFGCGTGYFTRVIAGNAERVLATDLSDEMLEIAKMRLEGYGNVTVLKADCENPSLPPEDFDTVFMANVLHVIQNPIKALKEGYRLLRKGGLLLVVSYTDHGMDWFEKAALGIRYLLVFGMPPPCGLRNFSPEELDRLARDAGFTVEEVSLIRDRAGALYLRGRKP